MKPQNFNSKYFLWTTVAVLLALLGISICAILLGTSAQGIFADRFEYRGLTRVDAEQRGIRGLPLGISSYYIKRCSFRDSWIVFSKYKIENPKIRKEQIRRFQKNAGLNKRYYSYPVDWPQNFDRDNCRPDWWEPCAQGEWAEIGRGSDSKKRKDGFYLCEWEQELRWFVFRFRDIE